jgi:RNA polymerase-binding transcription factor DksA
MIDLEPYKRKLFETYERLMAEREEMDDDLSSNNILSETGEITANDNHPADMGTEFFLRGRDEALEGNLEGIIDQCKRAIQKIEDGTYGFSDISGEFIGEERLAAVPYATTTIEEQERIIEG